jgi:hypothetical protein
MTRTALAVLVLVLVGGAAVSGEGLPSSDHPVAQNAPVAAPRTLRAVLEELCAREGILLRYEGPSRWAPDVDVAHLSVAESVARLLKGISYVQTVRRDRDTGATRLAALHVLGGDASSDEGVARTVEPFAVRVRLLDAAFGADDLDAAGLEQLVADVRSHPDRLEAFIATDTAMMAESLARYPNAPQVLRALISRADVDARSQAKLRDILAALE